MVMTAKLSRLTHKVAIQLLIVTAVPFGVLAPDSQSGNFWLHPCTSQIAMLLCDCIYTQVSKPQGPRSV